MLIHLFAFFAAFTSVVFVVAATDYEELLKNQKEQSYWKNDGLDELQAALKNTINNGIAKNVILFVGDGMGPNTITAARIFHDGESSSFSFEKFPHIGLLKTYALDNTVPDSACTATALFSGVKGTYETAGLDGGVNLRDCEASLDPKHHVSNIIEWAQEAGKSTGFVTTTRVTHATPSAIYSHIADRKWECDATMPKDTKCKDIARQLIEENTGKNLNVIMGGGRQCLKANSQSRPNDPVDTWACARADGRDLIEEWKEDKRKKNASWNYVETLEELNSLDWSTQYVMGIFSNSHLPYIDQRIPSPPPNDLGANQGEKEEDWEESKKARQQSTVPSLPDMVRSAVLTLQKNKKGFVLIVEGGMIDQAHHRGYVRRALMETIEFHEAVELANELTNSSETLLLVTADHAHALTINGITTGRNDIFGVAKPSVYRKENVPVSILTYAVGGPKNFQYSVKDGSVTRTDPRTLDTSKADYMPQSGFLDDEVRHGGVDVPIFAQGPMAHLFHCVHEQSYVAHVIAYAAAIGDHQNRTDVNQSSSSNSKISFYAILLCSCIFWLLN